MGKQKRYFSLVKNKKGQSLIEYLLLLAVIVFLTALVFRSGLFRQWMGADSPLFSEVRRQMIFSYCNPMPAGPNAQEGCDHDYQSKLPSYIDNDTPRFFLPSEGYP